MKSCASKCERESLFAARAVDDGEVAFLPRGFERAEIRVQAEDAVERHGVALLHREARAEFVVVVVLDRRDEREAIGGAAEEDDDERARVVAFRGEVGERCSCQQRWKAGEASSSARPSPDLRKASLSSGAGWRLSSGGHERGVAAERRAQFLRGRCGCP